MLNNKLLKNLDFSLVIIVTIIFAFGVVMIASATGVHIDGLNRQIIVQLISYGIGLFVVWIMLMFDYQTLGNFYKLVYVGSIIVLLLVYVPGLGVVRNNARSWIDLKVIDVQTSEIAKIGFIIAFAKYLDLKERPIEHLSDLIGPALFIAPFLLLLLEQPDLGSALVFVSIAFGMVYVHGINLRLIIAGIVAAFVSLPIIYNLLENHQKQRIDAFLNPNDPTLPGNYHVMQSKITIGSGQLRGTGIFEGVFHREDFLPVQETDFIFAVLGEELGFVGGAILIFLYFLFLEKMLSMAKKTKDQYGSLIIVGVVFMFAFQIIENIGMTMGMMPVTGVTLPFFSYGGSSVITSMMAVGLVLSVHMRRKRGSFNV